MGTSIRHRCIKLDVRDSKEDWEPYTAATCAARLAERSRHPVRRHRTCPTARIARRGPLVAPLLTSLRASAWATPDTTVLIAATIS